MHAEAREAVCDMLDRLKLHAARCWRARPIVLEIGARDINGSIRPDVMARWSTARYVASDIAPGPDVDLVRAGQAITPADIAHALGSAWVSPSTIDPPVSAVGPFPDLILCVETLEHVRAWQAVIANALALLTPGGVLIVTCATSPRAPHSAKHGGSLEPDEYYGNVRPASLLLAFEAIGDELARVECTIDAIRGDLYALMVHR